MGVSVCYAPTHATFCVRFRFRPRSVHHYCAARFKCVPGIAHRADVRRLWRELNGSNGPDRQ